MAYADFNEPYTSRTAGLQEWLNSLAAPAQPMTPTAPAPPAPSPVDFGSLEPNRKAVMMAQEAMSPGSASAGNPPPAAPVAPPAPAFRDTAMGAIIGGMMPNTMGRVFDQQRGQALSAFLQNEPSDPIAALQGMAKVDPSNGAVYAGEMAKYAAANNSPIAKTAAEEAAMNLNMSRFKNNALIKGMEEAGNFANGGKAPAQSPAEILGQPAPLQQAPMQGPTKAGPPMSALQAFDKYPAQTTEESGGNPNAVSPKGAVGSKQIMPATGADPGFGVKPWDGTPQDNIRFGNDYYDAMLKKYQGNVPLALAGYNWGPGKTDQWIQEGGDPAKMPAETLKYIRDLAPKMSASSQPAQPLSALQQHQQLIAKQVSMGLLPYSDLAKAIDPIENQPTYKMQGDVLYQQKPGEAPTPYIVPPAQNREGTAANAGANGAPSKQFGFTLPPINSAQMKAQQENDKAAQLAAQNNRPIISNALRILDSLEPNLHAIKTGAGRSALQSINSVVNSVLPGSGGEMDKQATAAANIDKGTNDLALELSKFQPAPGSKGGNKLQLQTILNSKPGMNYPLQTNLNIMAGLRAKLTSADISSDIDQHYRSVSPTGITDENTRNIDDALKTIYPIEQVHKDGTTTFNQTNADTIRRLIPDAIANPEKYLKQASMASGGNISYDPTKMAENGTSAVSTPAGTQPKVMNFNAQGNLVK